MRARWSPSQALRAALSISGTKPRCKIILLIVFMYHLFKSENPHVGKQRVYGAPPPPLSHPPVIHTLVTLTHQPVLKVPSQRVKVRGTLPRAGDNLGLPG